MHSAEHYDLRPFYEAHTGHEIRLVAVDQVYLVCETCGFSISQDGVNAGLRVSHPDLDRVVPA